MRSFLVLLTLAFVVGPAGRAVAATCPDDAGYPVTGGYSPSVSIDSINPSATTATITASIVPGGLSTTYHIDYGIGGYQHTTAETPVQACRSLLCP